MRDNFLRNTLVIKKDEQSVEINVNYKNVEKEKREQIESEAEQFMKKIEEITGWR